MAYKMIKVPAGERVTADASGKLQVPDRPIIGFIEGDGIGPDITAASMRIWNRAVEKAYGGRRQIAWMELFAGEKANRVYGEELWLPGETVDAIREYLIAKGYEPEFGARPLRRALQQNIEDAAAELLLDGSIRAGDSLEAVIEDGKPRLKKVV